MASIIEAVKKIYKSPNALKVHLAFLALAVISTGISLASDSKSVPLIFTAIAVALVILVYMGCYNIQLMHNSFDENFTLPDFNLSLFKVAGGVFRLALVWFIYDIFLGIFLVLSIAFTIGTINFNAAIPLAIVCFLYLSFQQFVMVAYAKNFDKKGLWNIFLPFKFMRGLFADWIILMVKYILSILGFYMLLVIVLVAAAGVITLSGMAVSLSKFNYMLVYPSAVIGSYFGTVIALVYTNCLVQIYQDKKEWIDAHILPNND
ncbi:MAG: hypothetical protein LBK53_01035 [Heliobacteriaceae bacterium]|nr:hypothetical protein [Heliobacteriaceae bacterium]